MLALVVMALVAGAQEPARAGVEPPAAAAGTPRFELVKYRDRVERDGSFVRTDEIRVRLRTAQEVSEFGQIVGPFLEGYGEIRFDEVTVEKADGRRVDATGGLVEEINPYGVTATSLSADIRVKKLTIPGLEPGDRLHYRVSHRHKPLAPGRAFGEIKLWPSEVAPLQTYELDLPRDSGIQVRIRKGIEEDWKEVPGAPDRLVRQLTLSAPPPKAKADAPSKEEAEEVATPDVIFSAFESWNAVASWWWGISKDRLDADAAVKREAKELQGASKEPRETVAALHAFVSTRIRYLNVSFGLGRMQPRAAPDVLANRYGDCKDKHALLAALAGSLGIDVRPVLINSGRPLREDIPSPQQFDHLISVVRLGAAPAGWLWLDATNPFAAPGHLLPHLRDKQALLVEATGEAVLVRTPKDPPFAPRQEIAQKGTLGADGLLKTRVTVTLRADAEVVLRSMLASIPQDKLAVALKAGVASMWGKKKIENVTISDLFDVATPLRFDFDAEETFTAKGDGRQVEIHAPKLELPEADDEGNDEPAVVFPLREAVERVEIELPEGQQARLPLSIALERPYGTYRSSYQLEGRTLKVARTLTISAWSLPRSEVQSYHAFRSGVLKDRAQDVTITGVPPATAEVTAQGLRDEGLAAFKKKDYAKAAELLSKATELDPKLKDGLLDLGRARYELREYLQAVGVFSRQIEAAPFHEHAYAWRAHTLRQLGMDSEAAKDLEKQIEVAPFQPWSYEQLAWIRSEEGKPELAVELFGRVAALEPKVASRWVDLAEAQATLRRHEDARRSLEAAQGLNPVDWQKVVMARIYRSMGDLAPAGKVAGEALPSIAGRLAKLKPETFGENDLYWVARLSEAWLSIGEAAAAAGETSRAEKYLLAAWQVDASPQAGWALGEIREKQGRLAEAVDLWSMARAVPKGPEVLPSNAQARIDAAAAKLPRLPHVGRLPPEVAARYVEVEAFSPRQGLAEAKLVELRTVKLEGPGLETLTEPVLVLIGGDGQIERIRSQAPKPADGLARQLNALGTGRIEWSRPDELEAKAVRQGILGCAPATGCLVVLHVPGQDKVPKKQGSIRLVKLEPAQGSPLKRGAQVTIAATVRYENTVEGAVVSLAVVDDAQNSLVVDQPTQAVERGEGEVTLRATFTVPPNASRVDVFLPLGTRKGRPSTTAGANYEVR